MKLPFLSHCMVLDTQRGFYTGARDTQAQTRPVVGEVKLYHSVFSQRKHIPFTKVLEPKQVRQVSDKSNVRAAVVFPLLSDPLFLWKMLCVKELQNMGGAVPLGSLCMWGPSRRFGMAEDFVGLSAKASSQGAPRWLTIS